ncbi:zinc-ribbon domain-containing protein [Desulfovibrio mangrovi]|uniref:YIP1 family protein n=1 Tax=Desulfovibrio mangrovi TaxID=2976983 RepID=UPI002245BEA1|nr:YIP1 family protein [Desulfovibrio mangrovi]UZP68927.1 zinc-ribbon domain-containing protein [Desulfovibrio mangrovi]
MEIRCPQCGYGKEVDEAVLKPSVTFATCPECGHRFRFRDAVDENEPDFSLDSGDAGTAYEEDEQSYRGAPEEGPMPSWAQPKQAEAEIWAHAREVGFVNAFIATTRHILQRPQGFFATMSREVSFLVPFSYYMIASLLGIGLETFWQTAVGNPILPEAFTGSVADVGELVQLLFFSPVVLTLYLYALSGILHLGLVLTGVAKGGSRATMRVVCYSSAADLLSIVPVVGALIGGLMRLWIIVVGLKTVHGTTTGRVLPSVGLLFLSLLVIVGLTMRDLGLL